MKHLLHVLRTKLFTISFLLLSTVIIATTATITITSKTEKTEVKVHSNDNKVAKKKFQKKLLRTPLAENSFLATVATDQSDYSPGEYVVITGDGWTAGETVNLHILSDCGCVDTVMSVTAINGNIFHDQFLITPDHIGARFVLTATGVTSNQVAQTTFTDGNFNVRTISSINGSTTTIESYFYSGSSLCQGTGVFSSTVVTGNFNGSTFTDAILGQSHTLIANQANSENQVFRFWRVNGPNNELKGSRNRTICVPGRNGTINATAFYGACPNGAPPPTISNLTATPNSICPNATSNLKASVGTGNLVFWYLTSSGGTELGSSGNNEDFPVTPAVTTTYWAEAVSDEGCSNGNRTSITVTVADNTNPIITQCPVTRNISGCSTADLTGLAYTETETTTTYAVFSDGTNQGSASDNCSIASVTYKDASSGSCPIVVTRTWKVIDAGGNSSTCNQTINIDDNTKPSVTGSITATAVEGCSTAAAPAAATTVAALEALTGNLQVSDLCTSDGDLQVSSSDQSGGTCPITITRTYTITDACGNTQTTVHVITVDDNTKPSVTGSITATAVEGCSTAAAPAAATTVAALEALTGNLQVSDLCTSDGDLQVSSSDQSGGTCPITITRTYTITDACGNTQTTVHVITVDDNTKPSVTGSITATAVEGCSTAAAPAAATTVAALEALTGNLQVSDLCTSDGDLQVSSSDQSGGTCPITITRTYTITDACGNTQTTVHVITVDDNTKPSVTGSITATAVEGCSTAAAPAAATTVAALEALTGNLQVSDLCTSDGDLQVSSSDQSGGTCPITITRTYTITDACGNTQTTVHVITVDDNTKPSVTGSITATAVEGCSTAAAPAAATTVAALEALTGNLQVSDLCTSDGDLQVSSSDQSGGTCPITITRTYTITDACGNTQTTVHVITVDDNTKPSVTGSITATAVEGCSTAAAPAAATTVAALEALTGNLQVSDLCTSDGDLQVSSSDQSGGTCPITITRTYTITDACGNTQTTVHVITVDDNTKPSVTGSITATAVEGCSTAAAPAAATTVAALEALTGNLQVSDLCTSDGDLQVSSSDQSGGTCPITITRTYTITDACGNTQTTVHVITVDDNTKPSVTGSITATAVEGCSTAAAPAAATTVAALEALTGNLQVSDLCTSDGDLQVSSSDQSGGTCPITITRTYTITDACGNTQTTVHVITVDDNTKPSVTGSITATAVEGCSTAAAPAAATTVAALEELTGNLQVSDLCTSDGDLQVSSSDQSGGTCPITITRTYTITDACGNTQTTVHVITVDDNTKPSVTGSITATAVEGCSTAAPAAATTVAALEALTGNLQVSDLCTSDGDLQVSSSDQSGGTCPITITRTYTITDACGNTQTTVHVITVDDNTKPSVTGSITATAVEGCSTAAAPAAATTVAALEALTGNLQVSDLCTSDGDLQVSSSDQSGGTCPITITRTYTITDACGNTQTTVHVITVDDNTKPSVTGSITATAVEGCSTAAAPGAATTVAALEALTGNLQVSDVCTSDGDLQVSSSDQSSGTCPITITRTYTITDACGNTQTTVHVITVDDNTAPTVTCKNITVQLGSGGTVTITPAQVKNTASDNCGTPTLSLDVSSFDCDDLGPNTVTLTATDACGNTSTCTATVTVESCTQTTAKVSAANVKYQDEVTLFAEITANTCNVGGLTGNVQFYLDGVAVGSPVPAFAIPNGEPGYPSTLRATLIYKVTNLPKADLTDDWVVKAVFTPTSSYYCGPSQGTTSLYIKPRDASFVGTGFYTGDVFYWTPTETSSTASVLLSATVTDNASPSGDMRGARVTFYYVNSGVYTAIPSATNLPVNLVNLTDGTVGTASATVQINIGNNNSQSFTVGVLVTGGYINRKTDPGVLTLITISKPVPGGYICGGGNTLNTSASNGWIRGALGMPTCFSMDVKWTKSLTNPQGKINNIIIQSWYKPNGTLDNVLHTYMVSSTAISTFSVNQLPYSTYGVGNATFSSKANLIEVFDGYTVSIEGGANLQITMNDMGLPGTKDLIALTLYRKAGGIWFSTNWNGSTTIKQNLNKGNIYVAGAPQTITSTGSGGMKSTAENEERPVTVMSLTAKAFPNPSEKHFNLFVESGNGKDEVQIKVYNASGAVVHTAKGTSNRNYKFGDGWIGGIYFVQVRQGSELKTLQVMKQ